MSIKYIEELKNGDFFEFENSIYLLSFDFKKNGDRMAINTKNGQSRWISSSSMIETCELYIMDKDNNIIALKPKDKEDVVSKT
jgi:hypothetical protein